GAAQHRRNRTQQNLEVQPERPFVNVLQIQLHPLLERNVAATTHLPQTGDARLHAESPALPVFTEAFIVPHRQGPRTYQTHVSDEDVEELRQFVDAGAAQELSDRRDARIILDLEDRSADFVQMLDLLHLLFRIDHHRPEFEDFEPALVQSQALLHE